MPGGNRRSEFLMEVVLDNVPNYDAVSVAGRAQGVDATTETDVWDRADALQTQLVWVPPTEARIHQIKSTSVNDAWGGSAAHAVRVRGLTSWSAKETDEDLQLNGTANVPTANAYVIINSMICLPFAGSGSNAGTITATADTDATVSAQINPDVNTARMAILGIPSTQTFIGMSSGANLLKGAGAAVGVDYSARVNLAPDVTDWYYKARDSAVRDDGASSMNPVFIPPYVVVGPAIIKLTALSTSGVVDFSASFNGVLVDH